MRVNVTVEAASFRDPSGFVFRREGVLYRQVNGRYRQQYDHLMASGLYAALVKRPLLIPYEEVDNTHAASEAAYRVLRPEPIPFISYPYEWSFSQLKDAALTTLAIQKRALQAGMTLKDASAYNIQFYQGRPVLIDTLSFDLYVEGKPWDAYRQFCQHFLAPLALMAYTDVRLSQLLRVYIDGVPLDLASALLPARTKLSLGLLSHIHLHASAQKKYAGQTVPAAHSKRKLSRTALLGLVDSLESLVRKLDWKPAGTEWVDYYADTNYSAEASQHKLSLVAELLAHCPSELVWDLGANTGRYSRLASDNGVLTIAFDVDPGAVEANYRQVKERRETRLLPLVLDLTNPSPAIGWHNRERVDLFGRAQADTVLALALIHHLAISNNVPLSRLAAFFADLAPQLIVEFVPKSDSQVQRLLATREDIFDTYTAGQFERDFQNHFTIVEKRPIAGTERTLYLLRRRT